MKGLATWLMLAVAITLSSCQDAKDGDQNTPSGTGHDATTPGSPDADSGDGSGLAPSASGDGTEGHFIPDTETPCGRAISPDTVVTSAGPFVSVYIRRRDSVTRPFSPIEISGCTIKKRDSQGWEVDACALAGASSPEAYVEAAYQTDWDSVSVAVRDPHLTLLALNSTNGSVIWRYRPAEYMEYAPVEWVAGRVAIVGWAVEQTGDGYRLTYHLELIRNHDGGLFKEEFHRVTGLPSPAKMAVLTGDPITPDIALLLEDGTLHVFPSTHEGNLPAPVSDRRFDFLLRSFGGTPTVATDNGDGTYDLFIFQYDYANGSGYISKGPFTVDMGGLPIQDAYADGGHGWFVADSSEIGEGLIGEAEDALQDRLLVFGGLFPDPESGEWVVPQGPAFPWFGPKQTHVLARAWFDGCSPCFSALLRVPHPICGEEDDGPATYLMSMCYPDCCD